MHNLAYFVHFAVTMVGVASIFYLERRGVLPMEAWPRRGEPLWPAPMASALLLVFFVVGWRLSVQTDQLDFLNAYYPAAQAALQNDPDKLVHLLGIGAHLGFVNIPIVAYLLAPFALFPPHVAAFVFTALGLALTAGAWLMLVWLARLNARDRWILALLFVANGPLLYGMKWGNLSYFLLAALSGGLLLLRSNRPWLAGILLGMAAVIKPAFALFGLFFLFRRDWRGLAGFAVTGLATGLLSLMVFGWDVNYHWFENCILQYSQVWMALSGVQSTTSFLLRFDPDATLNQWLTVMPTLGQKRLAQALNGLCMLVAILACLRFPLRGAPVLSEAEAAQRRDLQYLLIICLSLIISPMVWSHYYAWMLAPCAFFLAGHGKLPLPARAAGWLAIALITPLIGWTGAYANPVIMAAYRMFYISHLLIGGVVWFGLIAWWLFRTGRQAGTAANT